MNEFKAFVPTMGALHDGHLELITQAKKLTDDVTVSIFVNPLQFENAKDLETYPRDLAGDTAKALAAGASKVWAPTFDEIYPGEIHKESAGALGELFEGEHRPGHFDGVLTVIKRLFEIVTPTHVFMGEKDFQQLFIIRRWVAERGLPIEIIGVPTVRTPDGLALSSRNIRLSTEDLKAALVINKALRAHDKASMLEILATEPKFEVDYADVIDEETFQVATSFTRRPRGIIAGWLNGVRLIDNMPMETMATVASGGQQ